MPLFLIALALQAAPAQGPLKSFGDWAVACDNTRLCEATSLPIAADGTGYDDDAVSLSIVRAGGADGEMRIEADRGGKGPVALLVDGREVARATPVGDVTVFTGTAVEPALRALANGKGATLTAAGKPVARVSLAGMAASLRFMDAEQGRAGTASAIVARGSKPAASVPPARPAPSVAAVRPTGTPATITPALATRLAKLAKCEGEFTPGESKIEAHALGSGKTLALVPCGAGAYNFSSVPVILAGGAATIARFDTPPSWTGAEDGMPTLVNAGWDAAKGELSSYAKGRGLGDCGGAETYVWDGTRFRLVEARSMGECRGSVNWLRTWVATPVPR